MKKILLVGVFLLVFSLAAGVASAQGVWFGLNLPPFFSFGLGFGSPYYGGYGAPYYGAPYYRPPYYGGYGAPYYRAPYYRPPYYGGYGAPYYRAPYFRPPYYRGYGPGYYRYRAPYYR